MKSRLMFFVILIAIFSACKKQNNFLSAVPNEALAIPNTLDQLQLLLQDDNLFNRFDPYYGAVSADDYYATTAVWMSSPLVEQNLYIWAENIYPNQTDPINDWNVPYKQIFTANTVLDALSSISENSGNQTQYNTIKGTALFFRAKAYFNLLQEFSTPYDSSTASTQLGVPLRLTADINNPSTRASEALCYAQVVLDFKNALRLLPSTTTNITQPTQPATYGFLARVFLSLRTYSQAYTYADSCLLADNQLTDYNNLSIGAFPIASSPLNEDLFHSTASNGAVNSSVAAIIDSNVYNSYAANDLRKQIFFWNNNGNWSWNGTYDVIQGNDIFDGIATDEIYLIRAECEARDSDQVDAMNDLNTLLVRRFAKPFVPYIATSSDNALRQILAERRKELIYRGLRWSDLRRLNQEAEFQTTMTRVVNGQTYTLAPNDPRYTLPIPYPEILESNIQQNQR